MIRRTFLSVIFAALFVAISPALGAQATDADLKEIQAYRLTVPAFKQVMAATRNLIAAMRDDPRYQRLTKLEAEAERLEEKSERTDAESDRLQKVRDEIDSIESSFNVVEGNQSLSDIEAAAAKEPLVANAFKAAGISARDYAKFMGAFLQATMIQSLRKAGTIKELPKDVNQENVKFVAEHQSEFSTFMSELEALEKLEQKEP
jgi:regulator of protease activity HflC (stomatin/prohibitin superfamily)